eukprot:scaffold82713_cov109-Phaeocystis_antarctica.AAC.1
MCNVTNGTAVGRRLLRWPLRAQLLCMSLAKNAVMMAPRASRRCALSEDFQPFPTSPAFDVGTALQHCSGHTPRTLHITHYSTSRSRIHGIEENAHTTPRHNTSR